MNKKLQISIIIIGYNTSSDLLKLLGSIKVVRGSENITFGSGGSQFFRAAEDGRSVMVRGARRLICFPKYGVISVPGFFFLRANFR